MIYAEIFRFTVFTLVCTLAFPTIGEFPLTYFVDPKYKLVPDGGVVKNLDGILKISACNKPFTCSYMVYFFYRCRVLVHFYYLSKSKGNQHQCCHDQFTHGVINNCHTFPQHGSKSKGNYRQYCHDQFTHGVIKNCHTFPQYGYTIGYGHIYTRGKKIFC